MSLSNYCCLITLIALLQGGVTPLGPPPKDYFVMSMLTLLCCFMPLGLVALIKSIEVHTFKCRALYLSV